MWSQAIVLPPTVSLMPTPLPPPNGAASLEGLALYRALGWTRWEAITPACIPEPDPADA